MADELNDGGIDGGAEATPSESSIEQSSEQLAQNPEIQAAFARVFGGQDSDGNGEAEATAGDEAVENDPEASEPEPVQAPKQAPAKKPAGNTAPKEDAGAQSASTLSPVLRQAAARSGWSAEDINGFYEANPELAERTFEKMHANANDLSMRYAQLGATRLNPQQQIAPAPAPAPNSRVSQLDALLDDAALKQFGEENGQDFVDKFLKPFKAEVYEPVRQMMAFVENQKRELLSQQINGVFGDFAKEDPEFYGDDKALTPEAKQARYQTAQLADQIHAGAALQGVNLSVKEALEQARNVITANRRGEIERKNLTQRIQRRTNRITSRPNARRAATTVADGAGKSEAAAMEAYAARAAELGHTV